MPRVILGALLALAVLAPSAIPDAAAADERGFQVPIDQVFEEPRTVALAPLEVPEDLIVDAVDRAHVLELVERELGAAGISAVPPSITGPIVEAARARGVRLDPSAGSLDLARYLETQRDTSDSLRRATGTDRLLVVFLIPTVAEVSGGVARWDGVEEEARTPVARRAGVAGGSRLAALSILVRLHGPGGTLLYWASGGLRLLGRFARDQQTIPVVDAELLADDALTVRAVHLALGPLAARGPEARTP